MSALLTPAGLMAKVIGLINQKEVPGMGQAVQVWEDPDIYVLRCQGDYSLRFRWRSFISLPVVSFIRGWKLDNQAMNRTSDWLELVRKKMQANIKVQ